MADRDRLLCPFCRQEFPVSPPQLCSGRFTDREHPSAVRPVLVPAGEPPAAVDERLAKARATYG